MVVYFVVDCLLCGWLGCGLFHLWLVCWFTYCVLCYWLRLLLFLFLFGLILTLIVACYCLFVFVGFNDCFGLVACCVVLIIGFALVLVDLLFDLLGVCFRCLLLVCLPVFSLWVCWFVIFFATLLGLFAWWFCLISLCFRRLLGWYVLLFICCVSLVIVCWLFFVVVRGLCCLFRRLSFSCFVCFCFVACAFCLFAVCVDLCLRVVRVFRYFGMYIDFGWFGICVCCLCFFGFDFVLVS